MERAKSMKDPLRRPKKWAIASPCEGEAFMWHMLNW
jgi:hypothetical protein